MADRLVKVRLVADVDQYRQAIANAGRSTEQVGRNLQIAGAAALGFAGIAGRALLGFASASEDAHRSQLLLQNTIDNMPALAGESVDAFNEQAQAIQSVTAADGDAIIAAQAMLGTFRMTGDEIRGLTPLVVDYARKFGVDLTSAAIQVGKAIDGQSGALRRNGVSIDETLFATDRYAAVQQALAEQVGGFAEAEGATFAGSLERIKNQLGDLAEGIGVGVVDAISSVTGPLGNFTAKVQAADPALLATGGRLAAIGTAATAVVGGLSLVSGTVTRMGDRFTDTAGNINRFGRAAQIAGGLAGVAGLVITVDQLASAARAVRVDLDGFNRALVEGGTEALEFQVAVAHARGGIDEWAEEVASQSVPAAERWVDALEANAEALGVNAEEIAAARAAIETQRAATIAATAAEQQYAEEIDQATGATKESTEAFELNERAIEDWSDAVRDAPGMVRDLERAQIDLRQSLEDYETTLRDTEATEDDVASARLDVEDSFERVGQAAYDSAYAQEVAAGRTSTAARTASAAQIWELGRVASTLAEGSPLRVALDAYIAQLLRIPTSVTTTLAVREASPGAGSIRPGARQHGGYVGGSGSGDIVPAMLEPGEFVIRKRAAAALGPSALYRLNRADTTGLATGGYASAPASWSGPTSSLGQGVIHLVVEMDRYAVIDTMVSYNRTDGAIPITVRAVA